MKKSSAWCRLVCLMLIVGVSLVGLTAAGGCEAPSKEEMIAAHETASQVRGELEELLADVEADLAEARERVKSLEGQAAADQQRYIDLLGQRQEDLTAQVEAVTASEQALGGIVENWEDPEGIAHSIGAVVLPMLPPQYQGPGAIALGLGGLLARLVQSRRALKSLADSTVKAAAQDATLADSIQKNAAVLDKVQTKGAKKAVDAAQRKAVFLPV